MRRTAFLSLALGALPLARAAAPMPAYALSGIVQVVPENAAGKRGKAAPADAALAPAIAVTQLVYSSDGPALRAVLEARDRAKLPTPVIVYMGGFTTNNDDVIALERDFRTGIGMTDVAVLGADLGAQTTQLQLREPKDGELAVKASTADASDVSDPKKFCFWLRIDQELMKVTALDATSGKITVGRGFAGSSPAAHAAGAVVLSPVYLGSREQLGAARHTNSWPGGPDYLRYALDPRQPAAQQFKGRLVARMMKDGYDGAWFDTFQPTPYNLCDALGRKVKYFWDFKSGKTYVFATYLDALKDYLRGVRGVVRQATGREPVLYANSATGSYALGTKQLFNGDGTSGLLDGYCFEDSYLKVDAQREKGRRQSVRAAFLPITGEKWLTNVGNHADAARSGLRGLCMSGPAGYLAAYFNPAQPNYSQLLRFAYGSFLLTVTKERTTSFGLPLLLAPEGAVPWPPLLFAPIGDPAQPNDIATLKLAATPCYARNFTRGMVVVNPSAGGKPVTVPVPAGYVDAITRQAVTSLTLAAADAAVLLRAGP